MKEVIIYIVSLIVSLLAALGLFITTILTAGQDTKWFLVFLLICFGYMWFIKFLDKL